MKKIESAKDAIEHVKHLHLEEEKDRRVILLYMNEDMTMIGWTDQTGNKVMAKIGALLKAQYAIIVTNHPDGSSIPAQDDIEQTKSVRKLLGAAKIGLVDHIIVGYKEFYLYAEGKHEVRAHVKTEVTEVMED